MIEKTDGKQSANPVELQMLIGGQWRSGAGLRNIVDPYRGITVALMPESTLQDVDAALAASTAGAAVMAAMPAAERAALLRRTQLLLEQSAASMAETLSRETGKALTDTRAELARSAETLALSAEEATRIEGSHVPMDATSQGAGKIGMTLRFPVGVVAAITPFNAPVNLACHKLGPALAAGNAVVLKAPPQSPWIVSRLVQLFEAAGAPPGAVNLLHGNAAGPALVRDPRVDFISFTGSSRVGAEIKAASGLKRVALELGGNGATIVHADANLEAAATACARNSMRLAGQSCISVQNVFVHESLHDAMLDRMRAHITTMRVGDPLDTATDVGTLIDEAAAQRVEQWVTEAVAGGARLHCGGSRRGAVFTPTLLSQTRPEMRVVCEEVFGPVVTVHPYRELSEALDRVCATPYGLQCGVFTTSLDVAMQAIRRLRVGGVIINGTSTWRSDQMPYGGIKASGIGREGPRYAIREMTDERLVIFNL